MTPQQCDIAEFVAEVPYGPYDAAACLRWLLDTHPDDWPPSVQEEVWAFNEDLEFCDDQAEKLRVALGSRMPMKEAVVYVERQLDEAKREIGRKLYGLLMCNR